MEVYYLDEWIILHCMLLVFYIQQYFNTSITVLTNQVWKLLIALFKVPNTGALTVCSAISGPTYFELSWWLCLELGLPPTSSPHHWTHHGVFYVLMTVRLLERLDHSPLHRWCHLMTQSLAGQFGLAMDSDVFSGERSKPKLLSLLRLEEEVDFLDGYDRSIPEDTIPPSSDDDTLGGGERGGGNGLRALLISPSFTCLKKRAENLDLDLSEYLMATRKLSWFGVKTKILCPLRGTTFSASKIMSPKLKWLVTSIGPIKAN